MKNKKKSQKKSFGRSFENAYQSTSNQKLFNELLHLELPKKPEKGTPKIAGVADPELRKKMQEQLAQSLKLAKIGTMTCGIANDINNPLAGIMGYAEIMIKEENPQRIKKYAKKIVTEANKAAEIISWMTKYSSEAKDADIATVDIHDVINDSLDAIWHLRKPHDVHVIKDFRGVPQIKGNKAELQQVFVNLFDNALDAINGKGTMDITTYNEHNSLDVIVSDSGGGIPNDFKKLIFEPFFTTKEDEKGTGLGLFITSLYIEKHHGKIKVESQMGKGCTFTITLPVLKQIGGMKYE